MAEIRAFRGFRYDLGRVGALSDVVAPPYDVIDASQQQALYERSPHNVIRLILNKEEPGDNEWQNRYTRAASVLRDWLADDVLVQDSARSIYALEQDFEVEGKRYVRKGFLARVRLEPFGTGRIYPHEETMPGPKADRLNLFRATGMNLSPIFGLYPDAAAQTQQHLDRAIGRALPLEAREGVSGQRGPGVVSRLWPISDQHTISALKGLLDPKPLFIADGHHRYETALRYLEERREAGDVSDAFAPANFVLMMLVSMSDPGLAILPTHRLVSGLPDLTAEQLSEILAPHFQVERVGQGEQGARSAWELIEAEDAQDLLGLGTVADGVWQTARFRAPELLAKRAANHSEAWQGLAVSILHVVVLDHLLGEQQGHRPECRYVHRLDEVDEALERGGDAGVPGTPGSGRRCQLAVLVPPATMQHVEQIAGNREKMPPKSTYFYPKLLSGLVFHSLKRD